MNKKIKILFVLVFVWIISLFISNSSPKKSTKSRNTSSKESKKIVKTSKNEKDSTFDFSVYDARKSLILNIQKDPFGGNIITTKGENLNLNETKIRLNEEANIKKEQQKEERKRKKEIKEFEYEEPLPVVNEEEKIISEMYNLEIQGFYKYNNNIIVYINYKGNNFEISDEGYVKISTDTKDYNIKITVLGDGTVTFYEKTYNMTIKKKLKE